MVVVCPSESGQFAAVAEKIASRRGEEVRTTFPEETDEGILYVVSPHEIDERNVLSLQQRLLNRGPGRGSFGIITGYTPAEAEALYENGNAKESEENHCIVLRKTNETFSLEDTDATLVNHDDATVERLDELQEEGLTSFSIMTNGRSIHTILNDGYLCGVPESHDIDEFDGPHPPCIQDDGEVDCPLNGELLPAESFTPSHMFFNSCTSMVPENNLTGLPVHAGLSLLQGATSIIAGYRPMSGIPQETALHYSLLRAGYSTIERCYILNQNSEALNIGAYPYAVFGRPDTAATPVSQTFEYDVEWTSNGLELAFSNVDAHIVDVTIPDVDFSMEWPNYVCEAVSGNDSELYYTAFDEGDDLRIVLYSWGRIQSERFDVHVGPALSDDRRQTLQASIRNLQTIDRLGMTDSKVRGQTNDILNYYCKIPDRSREAKYDAHSVKGLRQSYENAFQKVNNVRDRLVESIPEKIRYPILWYFDRSFLDDSGVSDYDCPNCGRPLFTKTATDTLSDYRRISAHCPKCIAVFDVPMTESGDYSIPRFTGDMRVTEAGTETVQLSFRNPTSVPMDAVYYLHPIDEKNQFADGNVIDEDRVEVELDPYETGAVSFEIDATNLADDAYPLYGYVVGNLEVYHGAGILTVEKEEKPSSLGTLHT